MTDLDELDLFAEPDDRAPRKCAHPRYRRIEVDGVPTCGSCSHIFDVTRVGRGKSSQRLGSDQERRIERLYGPRKVGEYGDAVDLVGTDWKWQSKATRAERPLWLARVIVQTWYEQLPVSITRPLDHMAGIYAELLPVVIRSYVRIGVRPDDYLFIRGWDWQMHQRATGYWAIPGTVWLDYMGRDGPPTGG